MKNEISGFDRFLLKVAPRWAINRIRAQQMVRHYEAASTGRRTSGWQRNQGDVNSVNAKAVVELRLHARDLVRNNAWARRTVNTIANNTVDWGIVPKPSDGSPETAGLWKRWADSTECDSEGRLTFAGIQNLAMRTIVESGEVLIRRRRRKATDGLSIPLQIQILEPDFLDTSKDGETSTGFIVQGVEFDKLGKRIAYWLFSEHPGGVREKGESKRIAATEILHVFRTERPGQVRGVSWFAPVIVPLKDFDEYEDATLMRQKIAAMFAAFVHDVEGNATALGETGTDAQIETFEPGMVSYLPPGKDISFADPPALNDESFTTRNLRRVAAGMGITYEDLTGDYSGVNFSSARLARLAHWANVHDWQWNMLIPVLCTGVWTWAMEAANTASNIPVPTAEWSTPPMPMIEPDKEGLAYSRLIRNGVLTLSGMVREQGGDPDAHFAEYAADMKKLDALGIKLDSDVRAVSQAGLTQERAGLQKERSESKEESDADRALKLSLAERLKA